MEQRYFGETVDPYSGQIVAIFRAARLRRILEAGYGKTPIVFLTPWFAGRRR
jgi:hypothetical protein